MEDVRNRIERTKFGCSEMAAPAPGRPGQAVNAAEGIQTTQTAVRKSY